VIKPDRALEWRLPALIPARSKATQRSVTFHACCTTNLSTQRILSQEYSESRNLGGIAIFGEDGETPFSGTEPESVYSCLGILKQILSGEEQAICLEGPISWSLGGSGLSHQVGELIQVYVPSGHDRDDFSGAGSARASGGNRTSGSALDDDAVPLRH